MVTDARGQFRDAISGAGLTPPDTIEADGELHRFASNGKRSDDAGWYVFYEEGIPAGSFGCWRRGLSEPWRASVGRKLSPVEQQAQSQRIEDARRKRGAEETRQHAEARERAAERWGNAKPADPAHPYLMAKAVEPHGVRQEGSLLLVPMRDAAGQLHSLQSISQDGEKRFLSGGRVAGCYFSIGDPKEVVCICEGFATGASIHKATGYAVAVAFNACNLEAVALAIRAKLPGIRSIVCADDDYRTTCNPGATKANEAALAAGGLVAMPDFGTARPHGATDFNDLARHAGSEAVKRAIANARVPEIPAGSAYRAQRSIGRSGCPGHAPSDAPGRIAAFRAT